MATEEFFLLATAIMNTVLAILVIGSNRKDPVNLWFSYFSLSMALWAGSLIIFRSVASENLSVLFLKANL